MLEDRNLLDSDNEIDLFALHYIYIYIVLIMHFTCFKIPIVVIGYAQQKIVHPLNYGLPVLWRDIMTMLYKVWKIL